MPTGKYLSIEDITKMRKLYAEGLHKSAIATRMGIHAETVHRHCVDLKDDEQRFEYAALPYGRIQ